MRVHRCNAPTFSARVLPHASMSNHNGGATQTPPRSDITMAVEIKWEKDGTRQETLFGCEVVHYKNGSPSIDANTGEVFDPAAAEERAILDAGQAARTAKHEAINTPILFWVKEVVDPKTERVEMNTLRGFNIGFFEPPETFNAPDDDNDQGDEEEPIVVRQRLAAWVKITVPTYVKDANKNITLAPVGSIVWMDVTHANIAVARAARPQMGDGNTVIGLVEIEVTPLRKVSFPSKTKKGETWAAWRMRVCGGWQQARDDARTKRPGGFRTLEGDLLLRLSPRLVPPEILSIEAAMALTGVRGGDNSAPELPAARAALALPETATQANTAN